MAKVSQWRANLNTRVHQERTSPPATVVGGMEPAACECKTNTLVLIMSIKPKPAVAATPSTDSREARSNPEIDGKIDAYIRQNPKHWEFLEATPKDRLQRMLIWKEVQALDRQQRVREGVMRDINLNPEMNRRMTPSFAMCRRISGRP